MSTYIKTGQKKTGYHDNCPSVLQEYLNYSESIQGLSVRTVNAYFMDLRTFFRFLVLHRNLTSSETSFEKINIQQVDLSFLQQVNKSEIYEYTYFLTNERANSATTRARKLSCLKSYFKYFSSKTNQLPTNPAEDIEMPKLKKSLPKYLSLDESKELLSSIQSDFYERDYCIITLFLNCGMRLSELVGINRTDIKNDTIRIVGKGNKERTVFLNQACLEALEILTSKLNTMTGKRKDVTPLFISKKTGQRLTPRRIQQIVNQCLAVAGLSGKGYSVHKLRHTAATLMYQYGHVDMLALKEILGHEALSTTQIYTHLESAQLKQAAQASPLSNFHNASSKKDNISVENPVENVENIGNIEQK